MCLCTCIHICMYLWTYTHKHTHMYIHISSWMYTHTSTHTYTQTHKDRSQQTRVGSQCNTTDVTGGKGQDKKKKKKPGCTWEMLQRDSHTEWLPCPTVACRDGRVCSHPEHQGLKLGENPNPTDALLSDRQPLELGRNSFISFNVASVWKSMTASPRNSADHL